MAGFDTVGTTTALVEVSTTNLPVCGGHAGVDLVGARLVLLREAAAPVRPGGKGGLLPGSELLPFGLIELGVGIAAMAAGAYWLRWNSRLQETLSVGGDYLVVQRSALGWDVTFELLKSTIESITVETYSKRLNARVGLGWWDFTSFQTGETVIVITANGTRYCVGHGLSHNQAIDLAKQLDAAIDRGVFVAPLAVSKPDMQLAPR